MPSDPVPESNPATPEQMAGWGDALVTAAELQRVYSALAEHPRVKTTPGSAEIFLTCRQQVREDLRLLEERVRASFPLSQPAAAESEAGPVPETVALPDLEPAEPDGSVFEAVKRAFHLEDFFLQQLQGLSAAAREAGQTRVDLQLKTIVLSAQQRRRLLEERYGFARSKTVVMQNLRRRTTRWLGLLHGQERHDID